MANNKVNITMKKALSIIVAGALVVSLAACGSNKASNNSETTANTTISSNAEKESSNVLPTGKTLIVYFSPSNSDTADAVTSATPRVGDTSAVEYVAQMIGDSVNADVAKIVPDTAYSIVYDEVADKAKDERDNNERPSFSLDVNPEDYDTILVGYPIWWYGLPMVMETFFDTYDFSGKTIIPFNTHIGSRDSGTYDDIAKLEPNATVLDGIALSANDVQDAKDDVSEWLAGLGY